MEEKELQKVLDKHFESFENSLEQFADKESMEKAFADFKAETEKDFEGVAKAEKLEELEKTIEKQGEALTALKLSNDKREKSFKDTLKDNHEDMLKSIEAGRPFSLGTSLKAVSASNFTDSTLAARQQGVGEIQRGMPYLRDLFNVVTLGSNTGGDVKWFEQLAVTNNAANVAEGAAPSSQSNITWVEKTLSGKRIKDLIKVSVDQIKDVDYVAGEVQRLVQRNMRLKENDQLLNGDGTGNNIAGILQYATAFDTTDISIKNANLIDLVGKHITQIETDMLGGATPNYFLVNREDTDAVRFSKDDNGQYIFPTWAIGGQVGIGGISSIENPLITADTLLTGDFSLGTIYEFDGLIIEMKQQEDDFENGLISILAYMRENLRVQDVDKKAFVKSASISTDITAINAGA